MGLCFSSSSPNPPQQYSGKSSPNTHATSSCSFSFSLASFFLYFYFQGLRALTARTWDSPRPRAAPGRANSRRSRAGASTAAKALFLFLLLMARFWKGRTSRCSASETWNPPPRVSSPTHYSAKVALEEFTRDGWTRRPSPLLKLAPEWSLPSKSWTPKAPKASKSGR